MKHVGKYVIVAVLTSLLKNLTYAVGGFNFSNANFVSVETLYDLMIHIVYFVVIASVIELFLYRKKKKLTN